MLIAGLALTRPALADDCNAIIMEQVKKMPRGGRYSVSRFAKIRLQSSAHFESGKFFFLPSAGPSFCSGATYLVFIRTIEALREKLRIIVPELLSYSPDLASGFLPEIRVTLVRRDSIELVAA